MVGIVLASHGLLAEGMKNAAEMLFGDVSQMACVSLQPGQSPEEYQEELAFAAQSVDSGDGAIILCDIIGGTPSNRAAFLMSKYQVISGINLALVLELLGQRLDNSVDIPMLVRNATHCMAHLNPLFGM